MAAIQYHGDAITTIGSESDHGGVYSIRNRRASSRFVDSNDVDSDEEDLKRESDFKQKQEYSGWTLLWLAWQATGIIYGDIGTSPLYVYSGTFSDDPSYDDLLGALSLIIWSLTLIVTVKYMLIVLQFNDEGEGGTFALYSLLSRYANIAKRDPREARTIKMERYNTNELSKPVRDVRSWVENSRVAKSVLKLIGVLGVSLIMSDGVLTPAQSVLGAIQGIEVVNPNVQGGIVIGVSCAILILLFLIQPLGTSKIATSFAPIVVIWLLFNVAFGIYNLVVYDHSVLKAFSPYFAGAFLVRNGEDGWRMLGGILLAFTGCEALFADLGAFSKNAINLSWGCFAYPCLLMAYIGQAAFISVTPSAYSNPFFNCVPPGTLWPSLIIAILAAIVASQAMITSTFQLLSQIMKLSYFPQIKMIHTSKKFHGQIYIPVANWLLMIGTVIVTAVYSNTTNLGNAYGVCVILVTFITTCMCSLSALIVWRLHPLIVLPFFLVFGALDGAFLSSVLTKVPNGAWFTLMLAVILSSIFILWRFGKEQQWAAESEDYISPSQVIEPSDNGKGLALTPAFGGTKLTEIKGFAIFFDKAGDAKNVPHIFTQYVTKFISIPEISIFLHLRPLPKPFADPADRYTVTETGIPNCYRLVIRYGYTDEVITEDLSALVWDQIRTAITAKLRRRSPTHAEFSLDQEKGHVVASTEEPHGDPAASFNARLSGAYENQILYIMGKEQMRIKKETNIGRRILLNAFLWIRDNTRSKMAAMRLQNDKLVEVGFIKDV